MYTDKKSILQLAVLLAAHGVWKVVLCPGSRDIPLVHTFSSMPEFTCYQVTDERSAGFFALGLALHDGRPAAVCCTSGSALLNLHPAVAEAFYRQVPLVVISADRPMAWIGQMDGQTLPQAGVFGTLVKKSVHLPEVSSAEDEWYCNRLINEALLAVDHHGRGPVHINVPVSEPFFDCPVGSLPQARVITRCSGSFSSLLEDLNRYPRRMLVIGQEDPMFQDGLDRLADVDRYFVCVAEHLANYHGTAVRNIDAVLYSQDKEARLGLSPDLLITCGGHIISKRLKQLLRSCPPQAHWHITPTGEVADLFQSLTTLIEARPTEFLSQVLPQCVEADGGYRGRWQQLSAKLPRPDFPYSEMGVIGKVMQHLPQTCSLHLANSSVVRYAQLFPLPASVKVLSNRGMNGIEGSLSAAVGYAAASGELNFAFIGDLSFFYDMNALWNHCYGPNLRILLLNNRGGEIFHALPGLNLAGDTHRFVVGTHQATARGWAETCGFEYLPVYDEADLAKTLPRFVQPAVTGRPMLLEAFTDPTTDVQLLKDYYHSIKS